jgi:DNA-nicking Smr family endonuclease
MDELDRRLFREAMRGVRRMQADAPRVGASRPRPRPQARFSRAERTAVLEESLGMPALRSFLAEALQHGARVVRVIHGKGLRSGNRGPVLKLVASEYLRRVGTVMAFASAREVDGGSGAILVLLARTGRAARR